MKNQKVSVLLVWLFVLGFTGFHVEAQQWIKEMPGYERYKEMSPQIRSSVKSGQISVKWNDDGKSFTYSADGKKCQFDLKKKKAVETGEAEKEESPMSRYRQMYGNRPQRGRQFTTADSPDDKTKAVYRDGKPFTDEVVGHYVYGIEWSPDGNELLFHRANRRQNIMEWAAANSETGKCRVVVHEEWLPSYTTNTTEIKFLNDNKRFIWQSERTGFKNYYLNDLSGKMLATLTNHPFEVAGIVKVDEKVGFLYYMARSGDNHMKLQLHRVKLDGSGDTRLTDPNKKYPLLVSNYGGPETNEFRETFVYPNSLTEYGFLVASVDGRNAGGKGKVIMDALYGKLGYTEMDDFAEGVKSLYNRPYFDKTRVGIYGTSFGGTTSAMCLLRFPDIFKAAVAN